LRFSIRGVLRDLSGAGDRAFVDLLVGQVDAALEGADLAREVASGGRTVGDARQRMRGVENGGDEIRARLVAELSRVLVTPIDREDLFRLSRSVDDVLDNLRDLLREWELFGVEEARALGPLLDAVVEGLLELRDAVLGLLNKPSGAARGALASKKAGANEIRRLYEAETARLFEGELSVELLKRRELLRRLDVVGLRLGEAADHLADGLMKRSL